jgi:uncharacterized protein YjiS (DUF1127 family)
MSVFEGNRSVPLGASTTHRFVSLANRAVDSLAAWGNARATRRTLLALSDRQLRDIGLERGQIPGVAEALAWR